MGRESNCALLGLAALLVFVAIAEADTPPGIAKNPSHARCLIKKYKHCYNLEHVCPKFCPDSCHVECVSCKPICGPDSAPAPSEDDGGEVKPSPAPSNGKGDDGKGNSPPAPSDDGKGKSSPPPSKGNGDDDGKGNSSPPPSKGNGDDDKGKSSPPPSKGKGDDGGDDGKGKSSPPPSKGKGDDDDGKSSPKPPAPTPTPASPPPPTEPPSPSPSYPTPTPKAPSPTTPPTTPPPSTPPTSPPPASTTPTTPPPTEPPSPPPSYPTPTPEVPSPTTPPTTPAPSTPPTSPPPASTTPTTPPSSPTPSSPTPAPYTPPQSGGDAAAALKRKRCKNRNYPQCYGVEHVCPSSCPSTCEVDCVTCKPVCTCDMPGAVCQDPRFIGGDGITFYFHGKKDSDFCLVTDPNLHINAHFIGKRNHNMKRDFTWVQSIALLFGDHRLFIAAQKTAAWDDAVDRFSLSFDGEPIALSTAQGSTWQSAATTIKRDSDTNSIVVQVEGLLKISAKVIPISHHESRIHNYGITEDDCFAHLDLGFKFSSLDANVNGVLGQTYRENYVSRVKMGVPMPVLGGETQFAVSNIFATDCAVSLFRGGEVRPEYDEAALELPTMKCGTGIHGRGLVCKR